jgi:hypothetical protein
LFYSYPSQRARERKKGDNFFGASVVFRYLCRQMKRTICILWLSLLSAGLLQALPLSRDAARQRAAAFLAERRAAARAAEPAPEPTLVETASPCSGLYIFNVGSGEGFVLVSGDDRSEAVLGYAESGAFDVATLPDNARAWIRGLAAVDGANGQNGQFGLNGQDVQSERAAVRPLLKTQWAQKWPYNQFCPNSSATGCVATAMAQVMRYFEWPQAETTAIPAYGNYDELPPALFDWDGMKAGYGESGENYHAVAQLMHYCGRAVQMRYGSTSSAYSQLIPDAMHRFFGYDGGACIVYRSDYTFSDWLELICDELENGRPVIYAGQRSSATHQFVCDGYDGEGFFHINWGWGGLSDGWFRLAVLNPKKPGTGGGTGLDGYTMYQSAIIGLQPERGGKAPDLIPLLTCEEMRVLSATRTEREDLSGAFRLRICRPMINHSRDTLTMGYGLALMHDGRLIAGSELLRYADNFVPGSYINRGLGWDYNFGSGLTGSYRIVPVCSIKQGKTTEIVPALGADIRYIEVELTETMLTVEEHPRRNLVVDDVKFCLKDSVIGATVTISNHGDDYDGLLYLLESGVRVAYMGVAIAAGEIDEVVFRYKLRWPDEQNYKIGYTGEDKVWLAEGTARYTTANTAGTFAVWYADGRQERIAITDGSAVVPPETVAVEFDAGIPETIVPNGNPNCLYYASSVNAALEALPNVVKDHYVKELTLHDGYAFYCPMAFTAGHVAYTRTFTGGYDGKGGGWDTMILPFDVETVTTGDGQQIDWFRSAEDKGKNFWVMTFGGGNGVELTFSHAQQIEANRPYLIAVPGTAYGARSLQGCSVTFSADYAVVHETALTADDGGGYSFVGSYGLDGQFGLVGQEAQAQWCLLNEEGSRFKGVMRRAAPFRVLLRKQ